ncbi:MAG TPA: trehalose-phosphatase [Vineibacter sp.]|nr:trehalose-phosphatase [Vineibacter sp.]
MTSSPAATSQSSSPTESPPQPPELRSDWALFLDLDGTLLDLALTPTAVVVPDGLVDVLRRLHGRLNGALAIVTGRPLDDIDRLLAPLVLPVAGNHGASARLPDGSQQALAPVSALPPAWRAEAEAACSQWPGTIVEPKPYSLALHYRLAPDRDREIHALLSRLAAERADDYEILKAHYAFELRPRRADKGLAIERLMELVPFQGRVPVFIGDDVTDESGRAAARRLGGIGLDVAETFDGSAARVREWLAAAAAQSGEA